MSAYVELRGVSKRYGAILAVDDVDLALRQGEIVGLMGKNGAGKSTLIRLLAGAERPDTGELRAAGRQLELHGPREAATAGFAFVHQELADLSRMTVAENLLLGRRLPTGRLGTIDRAALRSLAGSALRTVGLEVDPDAILSTLSVVERRLVMIARALHAEARLLVLDEPTASLNAAEIERLHDVLRESSARGVAIVYVTHRMQEVRALCNRVVVMRDGRVAADARIETIDDAALVETIAGRRIDKGPHRSMTLATTAPVVLSARGLDPLGRGTPFALDVRAGEVLGLAGLGGSGRTETLRQLFGADRSSGARSVLDGTPIRPGSPAASVRAGIAFVPENRREEGLIGAFGVGTNITLASLRASRRFDGLPWLSHRRDIERASRLMEGLRVKASGPSASISTLSGGNQQKALLARCLASTPRVLLLDEPTHGVDVGAKAEIHALIGGVAANGTAVVLVSSDLPELLALVDRAVVLRDGEQVAELASSELHEARVLELCLASGAGSGTDVARIGAREPVGVA